MGLSSNSLIHFTNSKNALMNILNEEFGIKYCSEEIITPDGNLMYAFPMVSFCDIPLSKIKDHIIKYGNYGIGLTKEWGQKHGLNPVLYVDKNSTVGSNYYSAFDELFIGKKISDLSETELKLLDVVRYMKNYEADLITPKINIKIYRFADEKEWRYVPPTIEAHMIVKNEVYRANKDKINASIETLRLGFEPRDIKYVIIDNDTEISEFIDCLRKAKGKKYSYDDVERLITRLITTEQIINDF